MSSLDASVVVVSYNTKALTLRCLEAMLDSATDKVNFEVIVVDNASHDGSAGAIADRFPTVRVIALDENVGWGRAVNRAASLSDAEFILLLNPDTEPIGAVVDDLVLFARTNLGHGIYTGRTLAVDGTDDGYSCQRLPNVWSVFCFATGLSTVFRRQRWANPEMLPDFDRSSVREVPAVSGCLMLVDRQLFLRLGGFDPTFFLYSEDMDLCARAQAAGARPVFQPGAAVTHIGGASSTSAGQRVGLLRGKVTYIRRHWSPARARLGVGLLVAGVALRAVFASALSSRRKDVWADVYGKRSVWTLGWPPTKEPRPTLESSPDHA